MFELLQQILEFFADNSIDSADAISDKQGSEPKVLATSPSGDEKSEQSSSS